MEQPPQTYTVMFVAGIAMVAFGLIMFFVWFRRHWRRRNSDVQASNGAGQFMIANAFFHIGMFVLTFGGIGLLYLASR